MAVRNSDDRSFGGREYHEAVLGIIRGGYYLVTEMNHVLKTHDLNEPQFNVMSTLNGSKGRPLSLGEIGDGMVQSDSNVSRLVDRLVDRGLATRNICPENRRKMDVALTKKGTGLFLRAARDVRRLHEGLARRVISLDAPAISRFTDQLTAPDELVAMDVKR